jgi:hypothetical protein
MAVSAEHARQAHRYLEASMSAGATGLPSEQRDAYRGTMRDLERKYPQVREHAIAGAAADFDEPLGAGEREHQRHLREREDFTEGHVREVRKELRGEPGTAPRAPRKKPGAVRAGISGGRAYARARRYARSAASSGPLGDAGSTLLYALGAGIALTLLYLALAGKGPKALQTLLSGVGNFVRVLVSPVDPLAPKASSSTSTSSAPRTDPRAPASYEQGAYLPTSPLQRERFRQVNPSFGPAPGALGPLGAVTGGQP